MLATKSKRQSLIAFISWRLLTSLFVIVFIWLLVSQRSYNFALDDTAEFYLFEDAENALFMRREGFVAERFNSDFRQIYWQLKDIPLTIYEKLMALGPFDSNNPVFIATPEQDIYFLAYQSLTPMGVLDKGDVLHSGDSVMVYVLHRFDKKESIDFGPVFIALGLSAFLLVFTVIIAVIYSLKGQLKLLSNQLKFLPEDDQSGKDYQAGGNYQPGENKDDRPSLFIDEFQQVLSSVKNYYSEQQTAIKREQEFSSYLSHELRQPLAKLNANLARIDQLDDLPYPLVVILEDVKGVSESLNQLSDAILQLWQDEREHQEKVEFIGFVKQLKTQFHQTPLPLTFSYCTKALWLKTNPSLAKLLIKQLINNSLQYGDSSIEVTVNNAGIKICNDVKVAVDTSVNTSAETTMEQPREFGYGLGLVMAKKICHNLNWTLNIKQSEQRFTITIGYETSRVNSLLPQKTESLL